MLRRYENHTKIKNFHVPIIGAQPSDNQYVALHQMLSNVRASFKHSFNPIQA